MKRVAYLYLPNWPIDRIRRAERRVSPMPDSADTAAALNKTGSTAEGQRACRCPVSNEGGWRPGARWARHDVAASIKALPAHQRPPMRELGRRSEAAGHPFRPMLPDKTGASYPGPGNFFQTSRVLGGLVSRKSAHARPAAAVAPALPPLVTARKTSGRVEIAATCPAAFALGLSPGMALTQARALLPGLDVRNADPAGDLADLERLARTLARRWTPIVALAGEDGMFLDLTGVSHLHGGEAPMARRLVRLLARYGVTACVAVADTTGAAWAVARFGLDGKRDDACRIVPPGAQVSALASLPVRSLRLDEPALELLGRLGIETVGALQAMPRAPLVRRFSTTIVNRLDQASGRLPEPLDPVIPQDCLSVIERFVEPIASPDAIEHSLTALMLRLSHALAQAGLGARAVELNCDRVDGAVQKLRLGFARPTRDTAHMLRLALRRVEKIEPGYGLDALALYVRRADPLAPQPLSPALAQQTVPDLAPLIDALVNRIGDERVWRTRAVESHVPERSVAHAPPLDIAERTEVPLRWDDVRRLDVRAVEHPWHPRRPRPARVLRRPERVDVIALLPDHPPRRFTWRGRTYRVTRADGPERIGGEWWRRPAERNAVRDYFQVEDEEGSRFWLYRRGDGLRTETGDLSWFLHGRFN